MDKVTLAEQMGAMAIVDDLRHRKLIVAEQLDLPQRREEVARKIREYYQKNGVVSDDELIERGVREFFTTRLMYEQPKLGLAARVALRALANRRIYLRSSLIGIALCALGFVSVSAVQSAYHHLQASSVRSEASSAAVGVSDLASEIERQRTELTKLAGAEPDSRPAAAKRLSQRIAASLNDASKKLEMIVVPSSIHPANYVVAQRTLDGSLRDFGAVKSALWRNRESLEALAQIQTAATNLEGIESSRSYQDGIDRYPEIRHLFLNAEMALASSDKDGASELTQAVAELQASLGMLMASDLLTERADALRSIFDRMNLTAADGAVINAILGEAKVSLGQQDLSGAESYLNRLEAMIPFAERSLSLQVVSRSGEKSGVERIYSENGVKGQAYFAIAEAIDSAGNVVAVPFTDVETDAKIVRKVFGVRISKAEFERLRADKRDGHIDDRELGTKRASTLSIDWAPRTLGTQPDLLMNW